MQEKEAVQEKLDLKTLALKNAKDEVQDLKLNTMNLIIANQILTAENTAKDGTSSVDLNGSKQNALNLVITISNNFISLISTMMKI